MLPKLPDDDYKHTVINNVINELENNHLYELLFNFKLTKNDIDFELLIEIFDEIYYNMYLYLLILAYMYDLTEDELDMIYEFEPALSVNRDEIEDDHSFNYETKIIQALRSYRHHHK